MLEIYCNTSGTLLTDLDGNFITPIPIPSIDLMLQGNQFPPTNPYNESGYARFRTIEDNTIYIDFGDGSPIFSETFSEVKSYYSNSPIHIYEDTGTKIAKIWFEYPQRVTQVNLYYQGYIGPFPLNLGFYNLDVLSIRNTRFQEFPLNFLGGVFNQLTIRNITTMPITFIPSWILSSRIQDLSLHGGINLENDTTNSIENVINIQDLATLSLAGTNLTDIPTNFKDITTLRRLFLGNNPFTEITTNINDCKQLTELSFGFYGGYWTDAGSNLFTSWGVGIANMPNLQVFRFDWCNNAPDTLPTGIETAPNCKTIWARVNRTQIRQDTFIENVYNQVIATASMATGQGVLRRTTLRIERSSAGQSALIPRPTGTYQAPAGYVQGSSNGTPANPMEMIYVLVNQYEWTIYVTSEGTTGHDIYAP